MSVKVKPSMDKNRFYDSLGDHIVLSSQDQYDLGVLVRQYPYFQPAIYLHLKSLYSNDYITFSRELEHLSIFIRDRRALFYYVLSEEYGKFFQKSGKTEINEDKTNILLNAFFESQDNAGDDLGLEFSLSHSSLATTDYFSYLEGNSANDTENDIENQPVVELKHQDIIDSFIEKSEGGVRIYIYESDLKEPMYLPSEENESDELTDDLFFTETLAKIYIKQKKYEKAYKIIEHLSLNYPKKNAYFADQLSFLEKLIINTKFKNIK